MEALSSDGEPRRPLLEPDAVPRRIPIASFAAAGGHALALFAFIGLRAALPPKHADAPPQEEILVTLVGRPKEPPAAPPASEAASDEPVAPEAPPRLDVRPTAPTFGPIVLTAPNSTSHFSVLPNAVRRALSGGRCNPADPLPEERELDCPLPDRVVQTSATSLTSQAFLDAALTPGDSPPRLNAGPVGFGLTLGADAPAAGPSDGIWALNEDATYVGLVADVKIGRGTLSFIAGQTSGLAANEAAGLEDNATYIGVRFRLPF